MKPIIILPFFNWNSGLLHREHMLAKSFSKAGRDVYFVNVKRNPLLLLNKVKIYKEEEVRLAGIFLFPYTKGRFRLLYRLNDFLASIQINKLINSLGANPVFYVTNPNWGNIKSLDSGRLYYDISDDYAAFATNESWKININNYEAKLINKADGIIITNENLRTKAKNKPVFLVGNGVDITSLKKSKPIREISSDRPRVGYIGGMYEWVNLPLVEKAVKGYPELDFIFVGPTNKNDQVNNLKKYPNFKYFPEVPWQEIGQYFASLDVGILPFLSESDYPRLKTVDSNKIYQYAAFGYPIISTSFSQVEKLKEIIKVCNDDDAFISAIGIELNSKSEEKIKERISFAKSNDWNSKARLILDSIKED